MPRTPPRPLVPRWGFFVLGYTLSLALLGAADRSPPSAVRSAREGRSASLDPARMNLRELRRLPGIGQKLALAIDRARESHDPRAGPLRWQDVHGIGPATEKKVLDWFRNRGIEPGAVPSLASEAGEETVHSLADP